MTEKVIFKLIWALYKKNTMELIKGENLIFDDDKKAFQYGETVIRQIIEDNFIKDDTTKFDDNSKDYWNMRHQIENALGRNVVVRKYYHQYSDMDFYDVDHCSCSLFIGDFTISLIRCQRHNYLS